MTKKPHYIRRDPTAPKPPEHLGGGRERCHYDPTVLAYLQREYGVKTMLDVGCGLGCTVMAARDLGIVANGIDGDPHCKPDFLHDFASGPCHPINIDIVWSMEFLEHVEERYIPNYMPAFQSGRYAFVTYAPPGKPGHHHVNCQPESYWIELFERHGFTWLDEETAHIRSISDIQTVEIDGTVRQKSHKRFIRDHGLFFRRD